MPVPEYYSPEQVRKAAEAVREETRRTSDFSRNARRSLFNRAVDEGLLADDIEEIADELGEDPSDINFRDYRTVDDYPNYIPYSYSSSIEIDPDLENYTGYRLAGQDPKVRQYLSDPVNRSSSASPELLDQVFQDIAEGRVNPNDLNDLRSSFASEILNDPDPTASQWEAANFIEAEGNATYPLTAAERLSSQRGRGQLDPDIYSGFLELEEDVLAATSLARTALETETSRVGVQQALNRRLNELEGSEGGLFQDDARQRLAELASRIPPDVIPTTRQEATDTRNLLYDLQRNLNTFNVRDPFREDLTPQRMAETVLPSVRDALGAEVAGDAAYRAMQNRRGEQNRELRLQQGDSVRANNQEAMRMRRGEQRGRIEAEMARMNERARNPVDINTRSLSPTFVGDGRVIRQDSISGLAENIEQIQNEARLRRGQAKLEDLRNVLADYPEVEKLLTAPPRKGAPQRIKGEEFKPYMQYADTTQQASMPADRAALYDKIIGGYDDLDLENMTRDTLNRAEKLYTSGSTEAQNEARTLIQALADNNELQQIEKPAFRTQRPIVGGGEYVNLREPQQNLTELRNYIEQRSSRVNKALEAAQNALGSEVLKTQYPGLESPVGGPLQAAFKFDPITREVTPSDIFEPDVYRVKVSPARAGQFRLEDLRDLGMRDSVSLNALRFFRDNPVTGTGQIAFDTAKPGEDYSGYEAQTDMPTEVTQRFQQFIRDTGLEQTRPGTLVMNSPIGSTDLYNRRVRGGETADTSSTVRKLQPFYDAGQTLPNLRGSSYMAAGFGPTLQEGQQYGYVDAQGRVVPLQPTPTESALRGQVRVPQVGPSVVRQDVLPLASTPRYYSADPVTALVPGAMEFGRAIRRTPAALLPGAADLIPSPEAIQTGYREGAGAMARQMAGEFMQGLPVSAAAASALANPIGAVVAPGIGAGMVGVAGARALNEVVRQQTGEGIVPKLRQALGTAPRTGVADRNRARPLGVSGQPARVVPTRQMNPIVREIQNRLGLAGARFNPARGEFVLSELLGLSR